LFFKNIHVATRGGPTLSLFSKPGPAGVLAREVLRPAPNDTALVAALDQYQLVQLLGGGCGGAHGGMNDKRQ
jgi:hypothetical protein